MLPPPPSVARAIWPQAVLFVGGAAGLFGVFESAAPLIHAAGELDPTLVFPARMGAAAAIGAGGATAITLMEAGYVGASKAKIESLEHGTPYASELLEELKEQRSHLPKEILKAGGIAAGVGAALGGLVAFYPTQVMWTLAAAVATSLTYSIGSLATHSVRAVKKFRLAKTVDSAAARAATNEARRHLQKAGLAALDTVTVAAVTHHMVAEVDHLLHDSGHHNGAKVVASSAEQLGGAMESVGEVAEALGIGAREAVEAAVAVRQARLARTLTGIGLPGDTK